MDRGPSAMIISTVRECATMLGVVLNAPAKAGDIAELLLRFPDLPRSLVGLYRAHDGERMSGERIGLFHGYWFNSVRQLLDEVAAWDQVRRDIPDDVEGPPSYPPRMVKQLVHAPRWVPFASAGRIHIALDLEPDELGQMGQVINFGADDLAHYQIAQSFEAFLTDMHARYVSGGGTHRW